MPKGLNFLPFGLPACFFRLTLRSVDHQLTKDTKEQIVNHLKSSKLILILAVTLAATLTPASSTQAASASEIRQQSRQALQRLYANNAGARAMGRRAKAVLVFPEILKAGFIFGAEHGEGTLFSNGQTLGYYSTNSASYGLQAGVQTFGYALFFMRNGDLTYLRKSNGWSVGVGPSVVIVDEGMAKSMTTTTLQNGVYAFCFGQRGLMAGLGLQGSKITPIHPN